MSPAGEADPAPEPLQLMKVLHVNAVVDGYERAITCFTELFEGQLLMEIPPDGDLRACLVSFGPMIYELFAPGGRERGYGKLLGRYGPYWHGLEFRVPDVARARRLVTGRGLRLLTDVDSGAHSFFTTQPNDTGGVALELFGGDWFADPPPATYLEPLRAPAWWADHPLGLLGFRGLSLATADLEAAIALWSSLTGATLAYREERPSVGANVAGLAVGGIVLELAAPSGPGAVADHLARHGPRLRSVVYRVADVGAVERFFAAKGVSTEPAELKDSVAADPAATLGLRFEFAAVPEEAPRG